MGNPANITGDKLGRLTAIRRHGRDCRGKITWLFDCDCGGATITNVAEFRRGGVSSCGCLAREITIRDNIAGATHGECGSTEYRAWQAIKQRCLNEDHPAYENYGGRGITICDRWLDDFDAFLKDVGYKPSPELTIDRVDNEGNYCPDNVKWSTRLEQTHNRRCNYGKYDIEVPA